MNREEFYAEYRKRITDARARYQAELDAIEAWWRALDSGEVADEPRLRD